MSGTWACSQCGKPYPGECDGTCDKGTAGERSRFARNGDYGPQGCAERSVLVGLAVALLAVLIGRTK